MVICWPNCGSLTSGSLPNRPVPRHTPTSGSSDRQAGLHLGPGPDVGGVGRDGKWCDIGDVSSAGDGRALCRLRRSRRPRWSARCRSRNREPGSRREPGRTHRRSARRRPDPAISSAVGAVVLAVRGWSVRSLVFVHQPVHHVEGEPRDQQRHRDQQARKEDLHTGSLACPSPVSRCVGQHVGRASQAAGQDVARRSRTRENPGPAPRLLSSDQEIQRRVGASRTRRSGASDQTSTMSSWLMPSCDLSRWPAPLPARDSARTVQEPGAA